MSRRSDLLTSLRFGDCQGQAAHDAQIGHVDLLDAAQIRVRWRSGGDEPDGPDRRGNDGQPHKGSPSNDHASDSMIVPLASPPPSHIV